MKLEASWSQPQKGKEKTEDKQEVKWVSTNSFLCGLEEKQKTKTEKERKCCYIIMINKKTSKDESMVFLVEFQIWTLKSISGV